MSFLNSLVLRPRFLVSEDHHGLGITMEQYRSLWSDTVDFLTAAHESDLPPLQDDPEQGLCLLMDRLNRKWNVSCLMDDGDGNAPPTFTLMETVRVTDGWKTFLVPIEGTFKLAEDFGIIVRRFIKGVLKAAMDDPFCHEDYYKDLVCDYVFEDGDAEAIDMVNDFYDTDGKIGARRKAYSDCLPLTESELFAYSPREQERELYDFLVANRGYLHSGVDLYAHGEYEGCGYEMDDYFFNMGVYYGAVWSLDDDENYPYSVINNIMQGNLDSGVNPQCLCVREEVGKDGPIGNSYVHQWQAFFEQLIDRMQAL